MCMENIFGKRLKELRKENGLGQVKLSEKLNVSKAIISLWENGHREPGIYAIRAICDFFNVSADYMLGRVDFY